MCGVIAGYNAVMYVYLQGPPPQTPAPHSTYRQKKQKQKTFQHKECLIFFAGWEEVTTFPVKVLYSKVQSCTPPWIWDSTEFNSKKKPEKGPNVRSQCFTKFKLAQSQRKETKFGCSFKGKCLS